MAEILSGIKARDAIVSTLAERIFKLAEKPTLAILQVGDRPDSSAYIRQKKLLADKIGAVVIHKQFPETISEQDLLRAIRVCNLDLYVHGIILQIPIPERLDKEKLINAIDPKKDVDGLTLINRERFEADDPHAFTPATARGVLSLCRFYNVVLKDKKVTVIGKSSLVGKPIANVCSYKGAHVTVCDKKTGDLIPFTKSADVIIVAAGHPKLITKDHVSEGQTIIDVGINSVEGKLVGDVDYEAVAPIVEAITPVPGGVGPMTVVSLFENLLDAYEHNNN